MKVTEFNLPKPNEEGRKTEDYHWVNPQLGNNINSNYESLSFPRLVAVVSDGAGGVGLFAAEWAKQLVDWVVDHFQETSINNISEFEAIVIANWQAFQDNHLGKLTSDSSQYEKFTIQGSLATLLALWQTDETSFHLFVIGDTCIIKVEESNIQIYPEEYQNSQMFAKAPALISLYESIESRSKCVYQFTSKIGDRLILATDAIAEHCIIELNVAAPLSKLNDWMNNIGSKRDGIVKSYFEKQLQKQSLRADDYTFITITI